MLRAFQRTTRQSPYKMRLVIDQIRGKYVNEALALLTFSKKHAAKQIEKTLKSAIANAEFKAREANESLDLDRLYVKLAIVNEGPKLKRFMPAAMGRANANPQADEPRRDRRGREGRGSTLMGQKTNPIGFRLGVTRDHRSKWYANRDFPALLREDELLRKYLHARLGHAAISDLTIERKPGKVVVTVHTGRPGVVIGKKGAEVDKLRDELAQLTGKEVGINVEEIKQPGARLAARRGQHRAPARAAHLVPPRDEARGAERDAHGRAGDQDQGRRPARRRGDRARRGLSRGAGAAAHAAREDRLRHVDGEDDVRHDRREGVDLPR